MRACLAPTTRRPPRSACLPASGLAWWACPRCSRPSPPGISAPKSSASRSSPTSRPGSLRSRSGTRMFSQPEHKPLPASAGCSPRYWRGTAEMVTDDLHARAAAWLAEDPDAADRAELTGLLSDASAEAEADLADRFSGRLTFGTAGLRGAVGAGPNRMNRATVTAATAALADWLLARDPAAARAGVVVGCDARHRSTEFAAQAARVLAGAGIRVHVLPERQPTPLLAFAVRYYRAAAGVMVTASRRPPGDNGYKLYLADGAQIIPPADSDIESAIAALGPLSEVSVAAPDSPLISYAGDEVARAYLDAMGAELGHAPSGAAWIRVVYTPLHGVAGQLALRAFTEAGYAAPDVVAAQFDPDADFPTVRSPNPEEPGMLDLAIAQARRSGADLVVANDPDGDRLAVAVPDPAAPGGYRQLTGNQVGALLGAYLLGEDAAGISADLDELDEPGRVQPLVATTIVSATML